MGAPGGAEAAPELVLCLEPQLLEEGTQTLSHCFDTLLWWAVGTQLLRGLLALRDMAPLPTSLPTRLSSPADEEGTQPASSKRACPGWSGQRPASSGGSNVLLLQEPRREHPRTQVRAQQPEEGLSPGT